MMRGRHYNIIVYERCAWKFPELRLRQSTHVLQSLIIDDAHNYCHAHHRKYRAARRSPLVIIIIIIVTPLRLRATFSTFDGHGCTVRGVKSSARVKYVVFRHFRETKKKFAIDAEKSYYLCSRHDEYVTLVEWKAQKWNTPQHRFVTVNSYSQITANFV